MGRFATIIDYKLAMPADAAAIAEMSRTEIEAGLGWSWTRRRVENAIRDRETMSLVAASEGQLIGFGIMEFGDETAHLSLFAVRELSRRQGVGRQLFRLMRESALTAGIARIHVEMRAANEAAQSFYRALGFEPSGKALGYYRGREHALRMMLDLRANTGPGTTATGLY